MYQMFYGLFQDESDALLMQHRARLNVPFCYMREMFYSLKKKTSENLLCRKHFITLTKNVQTCVHAHARMHTLAQTQLHVI